MIKVGRIRKACAGLIAHVDSERAEMQRRADQDHGIGEDGNAAIRCHILSEMRKYRAQDLVIANAMLRYLDECGLLDQQSVEMPFSDFLPLANYFV